MRLIQEAPGRFAPPHHRSTAIMKTSIILCCILSLVPLSAQETFSYVSPKPGSIAVSQRTNIILRPASVQGLPALQLIVTGGTSGRMDGTLLTADDDRTIVFNPAAPFAPGERVTVEAVTASSAARGEPIYAFSFTIMPEPGRMVDRSLVRGALPGTVPSGPSAVAEGAAYLPPPPIRIDSVNNPSEGHIFLAAWDRNVPRKYGNYFFILDRNGAIRDSVRVEGAPFDFKVQPNGLLSYGIGDFSTPTPDGNTVNYYVLDSTLAVIDSFGMKNGYDTDFHEFLLLPNGHAMLMSYHSIIYDMSTVVPGGRVDAELVINVLQEQDKDKNVVFEWRNIDYLPFSDSDLDLTGTRINYSTLNAFDVDTDGNILMSFRNHSEIMKISRETGEILWRWGADRGSFTFIDEHPENAPFYFSRQHHIQRLPGGTVSMFDNGEFHSPWYSRAAEYELDEVNRTARLVSEYRYSGGGIRAAAAGNAQKLPDGGWFVGYGILHPLSPVKRNIVEVHGDGSIALELSLPANVSAYRAGKYLWREEVHRPAVSHFEMLQGNTYRFNAAGETTGVAVSFFQLSGEAYNLATIMRIPYGPVAPVFIGDPPRVAPVSFQYEGASITSQIADLTVDCSAYPEIRDAANTSLYFRSIPGSGLFQRLETTYNSVQQTLHARTTSFGEYVFAEADVAEVLQPPIPVEPGDGKKVHQDYPAALLWTGTGRATTFRLQIVRDSLGGTVVLDTVQKGSSFRFSPLDSEQAYLWRVAAVADTGGAVWSRVNSFYATAGFVRLLAPDSGGAVATGTSTMIRWESNLPDSLRVQLLKDDGVAADLGAVPAAYPGYTWFVSSSLAPGATYRIRIASVSDPAYADTSADMFSIATATHVSGAQESAVPDDWVLEQNFPNPFNPTTCIRYVLPSAAYVHLSVHSMLGQEVARIDEGIRSAGLHDVVFDGSALPSGVYTYTLRISGRSVSRKLILMK